MEYRQKQSRTQLTLYTICLDDMISDKNSVRFIDQFVDDLDLKSLGFKAMATQGSPLMILLIY